MKRIGEGEKQQRASGSWISWNDGVVLVLCGLVTGALWPAIGPLAIVSPVVVGHFFLFCNVFRIRRKLEITWAVVFVINAALWLVIGPFSWWGVLAVQTPVSVGIVVYDMYSARDESS